MTTQSSARTEYLDAGAELRDGHRYALWRTWDEDRPPMLFVGLNPSTADAETDDQTIRRCCHYARRDGYGGILMGNLLTLISTDPEGLAGVPAIGDQADVWLERLCRQAGRIVACWGASKYAHPSRVDAVLGLLAEHGDIYCLGTTKGGKHPRHPSRLANSVELELYRSAAVIHAEIHAEIQAHPYDVCEACGHLRVNHTATTGGESCMCWIPWTRPDATKTLPSLRGLSAIDYATELPLRTSAKGRTGDWQSSICPCRGFVPSGLRFQPEDSEEERTAVAEGRKRRTLVPVP